MKFALPDMTWNWWKVFMVSPSEQEYILVKLVKFDTSKPDIEPDFVWQQFIDIKSKKAYIACWFTKEDWVLLTK